MFLHYSFVQKLQVLISHQNCLSFDNLFSSRIGSCFKFEHLDGCKSLDCMFCCLSNQTVSSPNIFSAVPIEAVILLLSLLYNILSQMQLL